MKLKAPFALLASFSLLLFSCKKEAALNDETAGSFAYQLKATNATGSIGRLSSETNTEAVSIQWNGGTANATLLKFEAKSSSGEIEFKQNVQQQVDLFAAGSVLGNLVIPPGNYSEVEFKATLTANGNIPALELNGTLTNGSTSTPIRFVVNTATELKAEKNNITVAAGNAYSALNAVDLSQLTKGISSSDLSNATLTNGVLILSSTSNSNLYAAILNNLGKHHGEAEIGHH